MRFSVVFGMNDFEEFSFYHGAAVDIINFEEIAYHQNVVLYIIKPRKMHLW